MEEYLEQTGGELVIVRQLPVIEDRMGEALEGIQERLNSMSNLVVTDENYKELKKVRADLNKEFNHLESLRKQVKSAVEAPYKKFESGAYKKMADAYRGAIAQLDGNIRDVEDGMKRQKQTELFKYYEEYRQSLGIDAELGDAKRSGIKVGLSDSMKSLKEQARKYLDKISSDMAMIDTLEDRDEVFVEYRMSLDVVKAVTTVNDRHRQAEEMRKRREAEEEARKQREEKEATASAFIAERQKQGTDELEFSDEILVTPTVENAPEEAETAQDGILIASFTVYGTIYQLKALKEFLESNGYQYESGDE